MLLLASHVSFQVGDTAHSVLLTVSLLTVSLLTVEHKKYKGFTCWQRRNVFILLLWL